MSTREGESQEDALQRRLRESARVEERVEVIFSEEEFRQKLSQVCAPLPQSARPAAVSLTMHACW